MKTPTLCLMLKAPRAGEVKTRLAREIGAERAAEIYRRLVEWQLASIPAHWRVEIHFTPAGARDEMRSWLGAPGNAQFFPQSDGDLGTRLKAAIGGAFTRTAGFVICIGGDCPALDRTKLCAAAGALAAHEAVAMPALDGGYVLIGLAAPNLFLFDGIAWSTPQVLAQTRAQAERHGLALHIASEALEDVDDLESLRRAEKHYAFLSCADRQSRE